MKTITTQVLACLWAVVSTNAFAPFRTTPASTSSLNLYNTVETAIAEAQDICHHQGHGSEACRVAWDIVEELEAADSHRDMAPGPGPVYPDTSVLMDSFDILSKKIDAKMEQLKATTVQFDQMGASDPAIADLYRQAEVMQQSLAHVRTTLRN